MKQPKNAETVQAFLEHNRYNAADRDGWFSMFEITSRIRDDLGVKISLAGVARSLTWLHEECDPPKVEDAWMLSTDDGSPSLEQQYTHPNQPNEARRFYRASDVGIEYIKP